MQPPIQFIKFPDGNRAKMLEAEPYADAGEVMRALGFTQPTPAIFLSGGASAMTEEDMTKTRALVEDGIARFAADHKIVVIDGGTDTGIMQMMGRARKAYDYRFPLIGCAPAGKVKYPGKAGDDNTTATLEPNHSHFVLIDGDYWGGESDMIVGLTRSFAHGVLPACGILINGGQISQYDVYIASARGKRAVPVIVIDGSGRTANKIAMESSTGNFSSAMIKAIVQGGKLEIITLKAGPDALYDKLQTAFNTHRPSSTA
ncbi:MAG: hypothetical protein AAFV33_23480 [Chloroflexota bacterium]